MFQADDSHTTTPPCLPLGSALSILAPKPKYGVTRSQVMKRAWQLAKLNRRTANESGRENIGQWMRLAWDEARRGDTEHWTFLSAEHAARAVERQLTEARMGHGSDIFMGVNFALIRSLGDRLAALRIGGAI